MTNAPNAPECTAPAFKSLTNRRKSLNAECRVEYSPAFPEKRNNARVIANAPNAPTNVVSSRGALSPAALRITPVAPKVMGKTRHEISDRFTHRGQVYTAVAHQEILNRDGQRCGRLVLCTHCAECGASVRLIAPVDWEARGLRLRRLCHRHTPRDKDGRRCYAGKIRTWRADKTRVGGGSL
jgi:hypothetical protein